MNLPALKAIMGAAAAVLVASSSLWAQLEINPNLTLSGYLNGSARYYDYGDDDNPFTDDNDATMDLDTALIMAQLRYQPVNATVSYFRGFDGTGELLDAYISYETGNGGTLTLGKFLSWHGYESFHIPSMLQITYANDLVALIPGYHTGVKYEYATGASRVGVAFLDQSGIPFIPGGGALGGAFDPDGEIEDGFGLEAFYSYSTESLTGYLGLAYDQKETDDFFEAEDSDMDAYLLDLWLQYAQGAWTYAGELAWGTNDFDIDDGEGSFEEEVDGYFWLLLAQYALSERQFLVLRASGGEYEFDDDAGDADFLKGTVAYRHKCSDNFAIVSELSYTDFDGDNETIFAGIQGRFTF